MSHYPKILIGAGIILIVTGVIWALLGRYLHFGRLPGDIVVKKENVTFYFPVVTCIVISVVLSLLMYIFRWVNK